MRLYRMAYGTNAALSLSKGTPDGGQLLYNGKPFLKAGISMLYVNWLNMLDKLVKYSDPVCQKYNPDIWGISAQTKTFLVYSWLSVKKIATWMTITLLNVTAWNSLHVGISLIVEEHEKPEGCVGSKCIRCRCAKSTATPRLMSKLFLPSWQNASSNFKINIAQRKASKHSDPFESNVVVFFVFFSFLSLVVHSGQSTAEHGRRWQS